MTLFKTLQQGQTYQKTWILHPKLNQIFPENRIIKATKFAQTLMPFIAVFAIVWQQFFVPHSHVGLAAAVLTALFALCIPLQGLYWLGKRSQTTLPKQTAVKFQQISEQLEKKGIALPLPKNPTYQDLAFLLNKANQHLSDEFWQDL
ncbi:MULTISPECIES: terminus macrodomain insulation protein YfbV [unclassified Lonepinella]|uniref:terminus macrodomain insulation protein YfbV n=1 Tax=unclassified Lonepinella TaxID=2642006 RepID=UPI0036DD3C9B